MVAKQVWLQRMCPLAPKDRPTPMHSWAVLIGLTALPKLEDVKLRRCCIRVYIEIAGN